MDERKKILKEITDEVLLSSVSGSGDYNPGPSIVWGGIMGGVKSCSWPGNFCGSPSSFPPGGMCTG